MSGGKKQTYAHKYYAGWQAVLAHAGCFLRRIWVEDKEAWYGGMGNGSSRIAQQNLFGGHDVGGGGGVTGNFNYYSGSPNQMPDPYLEKKLGIGNVPASRGVCSFVWKQGYFGTSNYMKDWKFRLSYVNGIKPTFIDGVTNIVIAMDSSRSMTEEDFLFFTTSGVARMVGLIGDLVAVYDGSIINLRLMFFDASLHIKDYVGFTEEDVPDAIAWINAKRQVSGVSISSMISSAESFLNTHQTEHCRRIFIPMHDGWDVTPAVIEQFQSMFHDTSVYQTHTFSSASVDFVPLNALLLQADNTPEDNTGLGAFVPHFAPGDAEAVFNIEAWFGVRSGEPDMNPADMLWTCITNNAWGMGQPEEMLDKDSFLNAWAVLNQEDMYMSIVFDDEGEIEKIIDLICEHIDAVCTVDSRTNKWVLTLIRDDYVADDLLTLDESNVGKISDYEIRTAAEQINQITVTYWEKETGKDATVTAQDPARIAQNGLVNKSVTYDGFTNAKTAYMAAERDLKALSSPLKIVTLNNVDPDIALQLKEGNAFQWHWAAHGVDGAVMRVNSIDYGDDHNFGATIEAIEDVFSTPMNSVVPYVPPYENPANQAPLDNPHVRVLELQYYDAVQFATESEVNADLADEPTLSRVAVVAPRGQQNAMSAEIYVDSGSGYASKATLDYCPSAELAQAIGKMESTFAIQQVEDLEEIELGKWILVNDEHMAVTAISETEITVKRGVNYTVPQDHAAGSMILFCDDYIALDETDYFAGESLNVKALTKTGSAQLTIGAASVHAIEMVGLANRPYPPANVKINGEYWPEKVVGDATLVWVDRNRLQQTGGVPLGWYESSVTVENGVKYAVEVYDNQTNALLYSLTDINADNMTIDSNVFEYENRVELYAVCGAYDSLQRFVHVFTHGAAKWTPSNLLNAAKIWGNADNVIVDSSNRISLVTDLSGNNFNLAQSINAQKPLLINAGVHKVMRFDAVDDCLQIASGAALDISKNTNGLWIFVVAKKASLDSVSVPRRLFVFERGTSASTRFGLFSDDGTGNSLNKYVAGVRRLDADTYQYQASSNTVTTNQTILCSSINYSSGELLFVDNGSVLSKNIGGTANTSNTSSTKVTLGGQNGLESFNGDIYEFIVGNGILTSSERQKLEGWAAHKYSLTANLPAGHPYKDRAPTVED